MLAIVKITIKSNANLDNEEILETSEDWLELKRNMHYWKSRLEAGEKLHIVNVEDFENGNYDYLE